MNHVTSTKKYAKIDPADFNINTKLGLFPIGDLYEDKPDEDQADLFVRCLALIKNVANLRADDDTTDFSFLAVGKLFVKACNYANNNNGLITLSKV
jgi:hypothetical protein